MNDQTPGRAERGEMPSPAGYAPGAENEAPSGPEGTRDAPPAADTAAPMESAAAEPPVPAEDEPPREVVEYYPPIQPPKEVVLTYVQTRRLPGRPERRRQEPGVQPANWSLDPPKPEKKTCRGLWAFAACFAAALVLALGAFYLGGGFTHADDPPSAP